MGETSAQPPELVEVIVERESGYPREGLHYPAGESLYIPDYAVTSFEENGFGRRKSPETHAAPADGREAATGAVVQPGANGAPSPAEISAAPTPPRRARQRRGPPPPP